MLSRECEAFVSPMPHLQRSLSFYCDVLGFELTQHFGEKAAFISAGGYHHHIGFNTWESHGGSAPPAGTTGLYHFAILYPTRLALADALRRLIAADIPLKGASDHGVSESLYLRDPDQNGLELYCDRPREVWPRAADGTRFVNATNNPARTNFLAFDCTEQSAIGSDAGRINVYYVNTVDVNGSAKYRCQIIFA